MLACIGCGGSGTIHCGHCSGSGMIETLDEQGADRSCSTCGGRGRIDCPPCSGHRNIDEPSDDYSGGELGRVLHRVITG